MCFQHVLASAVLRTREKGRLRQAPALAAAAEDEVHGEVHHLHHPLPRGGRCPGRQDRDPLPFCVETYKVSGFGVWGLGVFCIRFLGRGGPQTVEDLLEPSFPRPTPADCGARNPQPFNPKAYSPLAFSGAALGTGCHAELNLS